MLALLALGGCASSTVVLLRGEGARPTGGVAVIDPRTGKDMRLVETAGSKFVVAGSRSRMAAVDEARAEKRYAGLLGYLPDPPARFILYFPEGSTTLSPESDATRAAMFAEIGRRGAGVDVQIEGHTDRIGSDEDNDRLSGERAAAARDMLVGLGMSNGITRVVGRGERQPVAGHETADNIADAVNRRVEVVVR